MERCSTSGSVANSPFPIAEDLRDRGIPFVFVTGDDATATLHYPDVPAHSKPSDMAEVVASLTKLIAARDGVNSVPERKRPLRLAASGPSLGRNAQERHAPGGAP